MGVRTNAAPYCHPAESLGIDSPGKLPAIILTCPGMQSFIIM